MHPGDPEGQGGRRAVLNEIINCRCTMVPVVAGDEELVRETINLERV